MSTQAPIKPIKIAIVGMTGSGKTVLISTLIAVGFTPREQMYNTHPESR